MPKDNNEAVYQLFDGKHIDQETFDAMMRGQDLERLNEGEVDIFGQPVRGRRTPFKGK